MERRDVKEIEDLVSISRNEFIHPKIHISLRPATTVFYFYIRYIDVIDSD